MFRPTAMVERRYRAITITVTMTGLMMSAIDVTAVVLALQNMMRDLSSYLVTMVWVMMGYLLVLTILGTQLGRIGDTFGRIRVYTVGLCASRGQVALPFARLREGAPSCG